MARVVITGCGLSLSPDYQFWGDLWEEGDCWVFNACGSEDGLNTPLNPMSNILSVKDTKYFQRRNVFVIRKREATLNDAAKVYLSEELT